jgi:hypothetical protein
MPTAGAAQEVTTGLHNAERTGLLTACSTLRSSRTVVALADLIANGTSVDQNKGAHADDVRAGGTA